MTVEPNPYDPPRSPQTSVPPTSQQEFSVLFYCLVAFQLFAAVILGPADTGRWSRYTVVFLAIFDIGMYFVFVSSDRSKPKFSSLGVLVFIMGSIGVAIIGTYVIGYLRLP